MAPTRRHRDAQEKLMLDTYQKSELLLVAHSALCCRLGSGSPACELDTSHFPIETEQTGLSHPFIQQTSAEILKHARLYCKHLLCIGGREKKTDTNLSLLMLIF